MVEDQMPSVRTLEVQKLRGRRIVAAATLTAVAVAFLLLSYKRSAAISPTLPAAAPSHQAADELPPAPAEVEQTPAVQTPMEVEPLTLEQNPDDAETHQIPASEKARLYPSPAVDTSPPGSEQRLFKSRKALETIDPREFLRQAGKP
jgi:hypothetical protein